VQSKVGVHINGIGNELVREQPGELGRGNAPQLLPITTLFPGQRDKPIMPPVEKVGDGGIR
jgi:hypothetical protein